MPHRKRRSFRDLDELVKLSPHEQPAKREEKADPRQVGDVHDLLFESAWRKAREDQNGCLSNQCEHLQRTRHVVGSPE